MYLLKVVQGIGLVSIVFGIWFTPYLLEAVIATFLLSVVGTSIAQHRYFGHRTFTTNRVTNFILALLATLSTSGSIIHWSAIHRHHHAHSDTEHDIHSPRHIGFIRCFFNWYRIWIWLDALYWTYPGICFGICVFRNYSFKRNNFINYLLTWIGGPICTFWCIFD